jgi:hypothetical protein
MGERSTNLRARRIRQAARCVAGSAALVLVLSAQPSVQAQTNPPLLQRYLSDGADMTSVPKPGEPGSAWFSSGADATTLPKAGQPGSEYFSNGADAMSTRSSSLAEAYYSRGADITSAQPGTPADEYFSRGADAASAKPGTFADQYFSHGAELTTVPKPGQFGAEYYSQGADATSVSRRFEPSAVQPPAPSVEEASRAQMPNEQQSAPEQAPPREELGTEEEGAAEEGAAEEGAAESAEAPGEGEEQAATLTTAQEEPPPPPSGGRAIDGPASTSSQVTTRADGAPPRTHSGADIGALVSRDVLDVLASYTLASMITLVALPFVALLVAFAVRANVRRHA